MMISFFGWYNYFRVGRCICSFVWNLEVFLLIIDGFRVCVFVFEIYFFEFRFICVDNDKVGFLVIGVIFLGLG